MNRQRQGKIFALDIVKSHNFMKWGFIETQVLNFCSLLPDIVIMNSPWNTPLPSHLLQINRNRQTLVRQITLLDWWFTESSSEMMAHRPDLSRCKLRPNSILCLTETLGSVHWRVTFWFVLCQRVVTTEKKDTSHIWNSQFLFFNTFT